MRTKHNITPISKNIMQLLVVLALFYSLFCRVERVSVRALGEDQINASSPPMAPSDLQVTIISATEVLLNWQDHSDDETGFVIYDNSLWIATVGPNVTWLNLQNLIFNASHCYRVNAYNAGGYSEFSNEVCITLPSSSPPGAATLVSPSGAVTDDIPSYTWYNVNTATWYYLYVEDTSGTPIIQQWYVSSAVCSESVCSITPDIPLSSGTTYIWRILTWNESGFGPWSSATYFRVETTGIPVAPNNLQVTAISATEVRLSWADNSNNETGFVIYDNGLSIATAGTDVTSTSIGNLIFNASHCYRINAYNEYGYSELSNEACINLSSKLGDANGDSKVDGIDYVIWVNHYGQSTPNGPADGDFDYSGFVDDADYQIWLQNYTG